jgi:hypothetical protein
MENNEGNTGVEKEPSNKEPSNIEEMPDEGVNSYTWEQGYKDQIAALIAAVKELIPIAEDAMFLYLRFGEENHTSARYKSAIERAKALQKGQTPQ